MVKVSVIVPVYNCAEYLPRCVESLLKQTLEEMEIILVDDGSEDDSFRICQQYADTYSNVKVKHISNNGAAVARIEGIAMAEGEYIGFVDSDDWVENNMYETLYKAAESLDADIVQCGFKNVENEEEVIEQISTYPKMEVYSSRTALMQLFGIDTEKRFNFLLWNKIYKASILKNVELPTSIKMINDVPVIPRAFYGAKKLAVTDRQYVYYFARNNETNKSTMDEVRTTKEKFIWSHIEAFYDVSMYFKERDEELYMASLKYTMDWALSAMKEKSVSREHKKNAIKVIKASKVFGNKYIPLKKKIVAMGFKICPW